MAKLTAPLMSFSASGSITDGFTYSNRASGAQVRFQRRQKDFNTPARTNQRAKYTAVVAQWLELTAEEKQEYIVRAYGLGMSGYNLYVKENISSAGPPSVPAIYGTSEYGSFDFGA